MPEPSRQRKIEVAALIDRVTTWASVHPATRGLLLVGSYARDAAHAESDVDFVLLTADESLEPATEFGTPTRRHTWGDVHDHRFRTATGLEFEINVTDPGWTDRAHTDPGTRRVVTDGARSLYDPTGTITRLLAGIA